MIEHNCALCLKERNLVVIGRIRDFNSDMGELLNFFLPVRNYENA